MRAVALRRHGGPEVLEVMNLPKPEPGDGEILIRVAAVGVNPADYKWRQGMFATLVPVSFPYVPGYDVSGFVEKGPGLNTGTPVMAMLDNLKGGAYAEFAVCAADTVAIIPGGLDVVAAAALPCPALTGVQVIEDDIQPAMGETVVITGATGSVGRFALFAAKRRGAIVVAAVRESYCQSAIDLGADRVIPLDKGELAVDCDHLVDTVGGILVVPWARKVKRGGLIRTVSTDPIPADDLGSPVEFSRVRQNKAQLTQIAQDAAAKRLALPPVQTLPLEQAGEAHRILESGSGGRKLLLLV